VEGCKKAHGERGRRTDRKRAPTSAATDPSNEVVAADVRSSRLPGSKMHVDGHKIIVTGRRERDIAYQSRVRRSDDVVEAYAMGASPDV